MAPWPDRAGTHSTKREAVAPSASTDAPEPDFSVVCDAIIAHVLTAPELSSNRRAYGGPDATTVVLVSSSGYGIPWPDSYSPSVNGWEFSRAIEGSPVAPNSPPLLGIRLDRLNLADDGAAEEVYSWRSFEQAPIVITLMNVGGGHGWIRVSGGTSVYYYFRQDSGGWSVECGGLES